MGNISCHYRGDPSTVQDALDDDLTRVQSLTDEDEASCATPTAGTSEIPPGFTLVPPSQPPAKQYTRKEQKTKPVPKPRDEDEEPFPVTFRTGSRFCPAFSRDPCHIPPPSPRD